MSCEEERKEWPVLDSDCEAIKSLATAIILRSIRDVVRYRNSKKEKHRKLYDEVYSWIYLEDKNLAEDPMDRLMSFEGICEIIGWDARWIRKSLLEISEEDLNKIFFRNGKI